MPGRKWTPEEDAIAIAESTTDAMRLLGVSAQTIRSRRFRIRHRTATKSPFWNDERIKILRTTTDRETADILGVTVAAACGARRVHGIPPVRSSRYWTADEDSLLGTAIDLEVARILGRTKQSCCQRRLALGIAAHVRPKSDPNRVRREWRKRNLEHCRKYAREYARAHSAEVVARVAAYRLKNPNARDSEKQMSRSRREYVLLQSLQKIKEKLNGE